MKEIKHKNSFLIIILIKFSVKAQNNSSTFLIRSTLSASGSSEIVTFDNLNFIGMHFFTINTSFLFRGVSIILLIVC